MRLLLLTATLLIGGCTYKYDDTSHYFRQKGVSPPTIETLDHCHGYGCAHISDVELSDQEWKSIKKTFRRPPKTAEQEREYIKQVIAAFESIAGEQTGTAEDQWGTFRKTGKYQHDCVDESTNTTLYLTLLQQEGVLKFHSVLPPTMRMPIIHAGRWPHQTAVIREKESESLWAVDSWFHDNGAPPEIVPLKTWKEGWKPDRGDDLSDNL